MSTQAENRPPHGGSDPSDLTARLADVRVSVRPDLEVSRHNFGDAPAYVIRDPLTNQTHRLSIDDYHVFAHIDTRRTLGETFNLLRKQGHVQANDGAQFYRYVLHLHQAGLLALPVTDGKTLHEKHEKRRQMARKASLTKLLFYRMPLVRPDAFLSKTVHYVAPLFSRAALIVWALLMLLCGGIVAVHWSDFIDPLAGMLATRNLPVLWLLLIGLKLLHESGHAWACKHFGGDVPEMGAFFILGTPCAYVDATASWGFPSRTRRIVVALAGMYFESLAMVVAILVWLATGPGVVNSAAQYAVVMSTVVTIGFNANPLMRYDGYYVASDLLNIPNLRQESQNELSVWIKWVLFGVPLPAAENGRKRSLLLWFGLASRVYMTVVLFGIAWLIATCIPVVGPFLAATIVGSVAISAGRKTVAYLTTHEELARVKRRVWVVTVGGAMTATLLIGAIPLPIGVDTMGSVRREHERVVHAGIDGFLDTRLIEQGEQLSSETKVCTLRNPDALAKVKQLEAELNSVRGRMIAASEDRGNATQLARLLDKLKSQHREAQRLAGLTTAIAEIDGQVVDDSPLQKIGRYVQAGEPLATIGSGGWVVRSLLTDEGLADSLPTVGGQVKVRLVGRPGQPFNGSIISVKAAGSRQVEDPALTHLAGGDITVSNEMVADKAFFEVTVRIDQPDALPLKRGMTAILDFGSRPTTIASVLWRRSQRLLNRISLES